jgi:hypothetical protein
VPRGPTPKPDGKAVTRHRPTLESVTLGSSPIAGVVIPKSLGKPPKTPAPIPAMSERVWQALHVQTREWWLTWLVAEQASLFIGTDWRRLFMVGLPLVEAFNRAAALEPPDVDRMDKLAGRIIGLEKEFGATPEARIRNRWVTRPKGGEAKDEGGTPAASSSSRTRNSRRDPRTALSVVEGGG